MLLSFLLLHIGFIFCLHFLFAAPIIVNAFPVTATCLCYHSTRFFCHYRFFFVVIIIFVIVIFTFKSRCNFFSLLSSPFYFSSHLKCFSQVTVTSPFLLLLLFRFFFCFYIWVSFSDFIYSLLYQLL